MECGAILDVVTLLEVLPADEVSRAKLLVVRMVEMLTNSVVNGLPLRPAEGRPMPSRRGLAG